MAIMNVSYDTKSKKMICSVDGNEMSNVVGCYLGAAYKKDEYMCELVMFEKDEANDMSKTVRILAAKKDGTEEFIKKEEPKPTLDDEVSDYFGLNKKV